MNSNQEHRLLTQFYRWFQVYERPMTEHRLLLQLELLDPLVEVVTSPFVGKGYNAYFAAVKKLPRGDRHAHHVLRTKVVPLSNGAGRIEATVLHQSVREDGAEQVEELQYDVRLRPARDGRPLPVIESLHASRIEPSASTSAEDTLPMSPFGAFRDAYPTNRSRSFLHLWLASMAGFDGSADAFTALLEPGFALDFGTQTARIHSVAELETWLESHHAHTGQGHYRVMRTSVTVLRDDTYTLDADVAWIGSSSVGPERTTTTRHHWILHETGERFVRLAEARSQVLEERERVAP